MSLHSEIGTEVAKSAPPVAVTASAYVMGMSLSDWASLLTAIYVLLQIYVIVRKIVRDRQKEKATELAKSAGDSEDVPAQ